MKRLLLAGIVAVAKALPLAQTVHAGPVAPTVPTDIAVPAGHKPFLVGDADRRADLLVQRDRGRSQVGARSPRGPNL